MTTWAVITEQAAAPTCACAQGPVHAVSLRPESVARRSGRAGQAAAREGNPGHVPQPHLTLHPTMTILLFSLLYTGRFQLKKKKREL